MIANVFGLAVKHFYILVSFPDHYTSTVARRLGMRLEYKPALNIRAPLCPQTPCAQFLKANVEYLRQNYRKALKVLGSAPKSPIVTDAGECLSAFYFNNIGCVHFQLGKYSLAAHYFRKATEENDAALNGFPPLDRGWDSSQG